MVLQYLEYNILDNSYSWNNLWGHITIEPSYKVVILHILVSTMIIR